MEQHQKIKSKTKYSSTILKYKLKKKIAQNGAVTSISNGKITSLENLAAEYKKAKSMMEIGGRDYNDKNKPKVVQRIMELPEEAEEDNEVKEIDSIFAGSSKSSISSLLDDDTEDYYQTSVIDCTSIKEPAQLIDQDILNLLSFIKKLPKPSEEGIAAKMVEFGDYTRHKTLIWDLDETLIHA